MVKCEEWDREFKQLKWLHDNSMPKKQKIGILREDIQKHKIKIGELEDEIAKLRNWIQKVKEQKT